MEGTPQSFIWNRIEELESAIEDRPKSAQAGREIAKFFFLEVISAPQFERTFVIWASY